MSMDIVVKEFTEPKIVINYEILKAELEKKLSDYKGLVVTEETLAGSKAAQKELASLRVKIDTYRKEKKKEIEKPIKAFEAQCKELIVLVESVEQPLKNGIKVFDDQKREEKRRKAAEIAQKVAEETGLNEKYAAKLDVLEKYGNLTATEKDVREDLETRAFALKVEQDREVERLEIIQSVLESENSRLKTKLELRLWQREIDADVPTSLIIEKIRDHASVVYAAENRPIELPKEEEPAPVPKQELPTEPIPESHAKEISQEQPQYVATYKVIGTAEQLRSVSAFLKEHGICYEASKAKKMV